MDNKKIKVLYFVDRLLWGGIQSLLYDLVTHIDKRRITIDVMTLDDGKHYELEDTLKSCGTRIIQLNGIWNSRPSDFPNYIKAVKSFFKSHRGEYDVVHMNSSCKNVWILYYAKKYGIKMRIAHSHNIGFQKESLFSTIGGIVLTPLLKRCATDFLACSYDAGRWMFGESYAKEGKVTIIRNAIDTDSFLFNPVWRDEIRKSLHLDGKVVYGCVGRFTHQKNHRFLIEIFAEIRKRQEEAVLVLTGEGQLEGELRSQVKRLGIDNSVIFTGFKQNRNQYLSAFDTFILTSKFEGLGIVLIEAQASALPCYASDNVIPREAKISDLLTFIDLSKPADFWADVILSTERKERKNMKNQIVKSGYDLGTMIDTLSKIYEQQ